MAIEKEYDGVGNITRLKSNGKEISYTYNVDGSPNTVTDINGGITKFVYNEFRQIIETIRPDGTSNKSNPSTDLLSP